MSKKVFMDSELRKMGLLPPELYDLKDIAPMCCIEWADEILAYNLLEEKQEKEREKERQKQEKESKRQRIINNIFFTLFMVLMASMGVGLGEVLEYIAKRN